MAMITQIEIVPKRQDESDLQYWLSRTPEERLEAVEYLRQQYIEFLKSKNIDVPEGLQRVYKITPRKEN